jgi:hypothetical protein
MVFCEASEQGLIEINKMQICSMNYQKKLYETLMS